MLNLIFIALMVLVFGRLVVFAIKMTWGILKVISFLIFLPLIIVFTFIKGLFVIAWPLLLIIGLLSLLNKI